MGVRRRPCEGGERRGGETWCEVDDGWGEGRRGKEGDPVGGAEEVRQPLLRW